MRNLPLVLCLLCACDCGSSHLLGADGSVPGDRSATSDGGSRDDAPAADVPPLDAGGVLDGAAVDTAEDAASPEHCGGELDGTPCDDYQATCVRDDGCCVCAAFGFGCDMVWHCSAPAMESDAECPASLPDDATACDASADERVCHYCSPGGLPVIAACNEGRYYGPCHDEYCWMQYPTFGCGS